MEGKEYRVHRLTYENMIGPIPEGLVIDHLCRNRRCCNPAHLEPVTIEENLRRGLGGYNGGRATAAIKKSMTHCHKGHEFTPENTYVDSRTKRHCKECVRERGRLSYVLKKIANGKLNKE